MDIWEEWNKFENKYAEEAIQWWMDRFELDYNELSEKHNNNHPFS
ncbi:hypothetical protein [Paenibacillus albidus]|nr:hypothetical protein [Paenibacillus albidus]